MLEAKRLALSDETPDKILDLIARETGDAPADDAGADAPADGALHAIERNAVAVEAS